MPRSVAVIGTRGYPSYYGGFETAIRHLAPALVEKGWDVTVYGRRDSSFSDDPHRDMRVKSIVTQGLETKSLSTISYGLTAVLHAFCAKPDAVVVMNVANGFWLPILKMRRIPTLVNVDGIEWERDKWGTFAKAVFKAGAWATARFGTRLVADSREIHRRWLTEFSRESTFIPYGGDTPPTLPILPGLVHRKYVLVVARFVPENTIREFFVAVEGLAKDYKVVIVGSAGYGGELDDLASNLQQKYENVEWLGHVSDDEKLYSLWQHAGVYFHGHSVGGTNPALVQAMACGAPIVARNTVYNREVLGSNGSWCAPTAESIRETIRTVMSDESLQEHLSRSSMDRAGAEYTWSIVCDRYASALEDLVERSRTSAIAPLRAMKWLLTKFGA